MGYYIETPGIMKGKADRLISEGAVEVDPHDRLPEGHTLICCVENPHFDACVIVYDRDEWMDFADPGDSRPKRWLTMPTDQVRERAPHAAHVLA